MRLEDSSPDYILNAHFLSIYLAVLFGGCVVSSRPQLDAAFPGYGVSGNGKEKLASHFYQLAISAIRLSDFPQSPSLHSLSAFIIVDTTWLREEQPLTCCALVGVAIRAAQVLGEHLESFPGANYLLLIPSRPPQRTIKVTRYVCDRSPGTPSALVDCGCNRRPSGVCIEPTAVDRHETAQC